MIFDVRPYKSAAGCSLIGGGYENNNYDEIKNFLFKFKYIGIQFLT